MSLFGWFLKSKNRIAKPNTKHVRIGKYEISSHAQNRVADSSRNLTKKDMIVNLFDKTSKNSKTYTHTDGTKQYDRVNEKKQNFDTYCKQNQCCKKYI